MEEKKVKLQKILKFKHNNFSYENLLYDLLLDFARGRLYLNKGIMHKNLGQQSKPNWTSVFKQLFNKKEVDNRNTISNLGYCYILNKAKTKYIRLLKESIRMNKSPFEIVTIYINKFKEKKINYSVGKALKINPTIRGDRKSYVGLLQKSSSINLKHLIVKQSNPSSSQNVANFFVENEKESKIHSLF
jgi:hypothetical protein